MLNPVWGTILNFIIGGLGLAETSGLTNVLGASGGKAGAVAVTVLAFLNGGLHGISSAQAGPFTSAPTPTPPSAGMRTMGLFLLAALLLWPVAGRAADLAVKAPQPAYIADPWTGFYLGAHFGEGWNDGGGTAISAIPLFGVDVSTPKGVVGGLHAGYGYHFPNTILYAGLEGDGDISAVNAGGSGLITASSRNMWMASLRARFGLILQNTLLYATAGGGWSGGEFTLSSPQDVVSSSPNMSGFVVGGGLEIALTQQWLMRMEYLRYDFGSAVVNGPVATFQVNDRVEVVRGGLTYKF